ncbi:hypothetical protein D3C78_1032710 [compost metagenome]
MILSKAEPRTGDRRYGGERRLREVSFEQRPRHEAPDIPRGRRAPPGEQPSPGDCHELQHRVPHGDYLVRS